MERTRRAGPAPGEGRAGSAARLARMMRQAPPGVALLSACYSGQRDEMLRSLPGSLSQSSITCVGTWVSVLDPAAVIYDVELMQACVGSGSLACAIVDCDWRCAPVTWALKPAWTWGQP